MIDTVDEVTYVRFQATVSNPRGAFTGVFGLVNGLAKRGRLTEEQERFRRVNNDWYDAAYTDPSTVDPAIYAGNPLAVAWFKPSARELIDRVPGYLAILAAHQVGCERVHSADPGRVIYEDEHQIVVVPH